MNAVEEKVDAQVALDAAKAAWRKRVAEGFIPKGNYLLAKMTIQAKTTGGIVLPDMRQDVPGHGVVVSCGPLVQSCHPGDHVFFSRFVGVTLQLPMGQEVFEYRVLSEDEVYGGWPTELALEPEPQSG